MIGYQWMLLSLYLSFSICKMGIPMCTHLIAMIRKFIKHLALCLAGCKCWLDKNIIITSNARLLSPWTWNNPSWVTCSQSQFQVQMSSSSSKSLMCILPSLIYLHPDSCFSCAGHTVSSPITCPQPLRYRLPCEQGFLSYVTVFSVPRIRIMDIFC